MTIKTNPKSLKQIERLFDMAAYLSFKRIVSAEELAERYNVHRATVFRDKNTLYDCMGVIFENEPGQLIRVNDRWHYKFIPLYVYQRRALIKAIEMIEDAAIRDDLISIL